MNQATVEPVPTPTIIPSSTNSMAFSAASRLASVMAFGIGDRGLLLFLAFQRQQQLPLRRGHRQHRQARALRSEEHTSELQSLMRRPYAVFCLKKKILSEVPTKRTLRSH